MGSQEPYLNAELFRINKSQLSEAISNLKGYVCQFSFPDIAAPILPTERDKIFHLAKLLTLDGTPTVVLGNDEDLKLVALKKPAAGVLYLYRHVSDDTKIYIELSDTVDFRNIVARDFPAARALLIDSIRSKIKPPLRLEGSTIYDTTTDLTSQLSERSRKIELLRPLHLHTGFSFQFRTFADSLFLQILPKSTISYGKSIWDLVKDGWSRERIISQFPYAKIINHGAQKILEVTKQTAQDRIDSAPYFGRSFKEFAKCMFSNVEISDSSAFLLRTASSYGQINYFPSTWAYPSPNFVSLSQIDDGYYSELTGMLRTQGRKRASQAKDWANKLSPLELDGRSVDISVVPVRLHYNPTSLEPSKLAKVIDLEMGRLFAPPSVTMLRNGKPTEIVPGVGLYQGTVNDLLTHEELKPLDAPAQIHVVAFVQTALRQGWQSLKGSLIGGTIGYRGFEKIFGVKLSFDEFYVENFLDLEFENKAKALGEQSYDCALTVIPRYLGTPDESRRIYEQSKTMIMKRGIPVQVVVDDPKITYGRDATLVGKSKNARMLFGLSINILAKVGAILTAISENVADNLIPNSVTLGYNPIRVIPRNPTGVKTIPLAAPLVIFDNKGAYISHQEIYKLKNEVSLFDEYGDDIFQKITREASRVIVHKDGFFTTTELADLEALSKMHGVETIPMSIRTNYVPRVSNPQYLDSELGLKAGTILPLSQQDYLMMTTPFSGWDPERLGWPNPILITLHDSKKYDAPTILRLLYHAFALTKMQTGSQRAVRLSVSIHFANMIGRFLRRVGDPNPTYLKYFVQAREGGKYLPRWFL